MLQMAARIATIHLHRSRFWGPGATAPIARGTPRRKDRAATESAASVPVSSKSSP